MLTFPPNLGFLCCAVLLFMSSLIKGQYPRMGTLRAYFFNILVNHNVHEDFAYRLDALRKVRQHNCVPSL